ncbi:MAG: PKD domain-containing protein [Bacteroidetes bacterium]|nr:PKD domain-containing protein [Bacteroidota bacterium]
MKKLNVLFGLIVLFSWLTLSSFSQAVSLEKIITPVGFDKSEKLSSVPIVPPGYRDMSWKDRTIPNKDGFQEEFNKPATWVGPDPVLQNEMSGNRSAATVGQNFAGVSNLSGVAPPDTDGDVGPNHYMQMVNLSFQIWDKNGNSLYGPAASSTIWDGFTGPWSGTNDGDPIVLYDEYADRWIASQFALPNYPSGPFYELVAVSETGDPTGAWYRYAYEFSNMPDYPKFGVWPDGYYFTINQFAPPSLGYAGGAVCVLDRDAMLIGDPNAEMLFFNLGTSYGSLLPADADGATQPAAGSPNYLMNLGSTSLRIWEVDVDWSNTNNSSVSLVKTVSVQSYSYSGITINQPGTSQTLDALASRLMFRLQYRNFGAYEVMLTNHTVNADGSGQAGVRWYELRNYGSGWNMYQQGTFAPADGDNRWMGSVAMNGNGDIGIGYSVSSSSTYPSIRFAGQTAANSGSGILDVDETSIIEGSNSQTGVNRWGDYSMMSVDPSDDQTFWYTTEYSNGGWSWRTQVASFNFTPPVVEIPVAAFVGTPTSVEEGETVTFTDQSTNNPTSWSWSFPGGSPSTSTLQNPVVTYPTEGTYNVSLTVSNSAGSDIHNETGYITVTAPVILVPVAAFSGTPTTLMEGQTVTYTDQSANDPTSWSWSFPGGSPSTSDLQNPLVTYLTTGTYGVSLTATNSGGSDTHTETNYINVAEYTISYCTSSGNSSSLEWIQSIALGTYTNNSGSDGGYGDFTSSAISVESGQSYTFIITPGFSGRARKEFMRVWIDFNVDGDFTDSGELVFSADRRKGVTTGIINIPSGLTGETRMRVSMKYNAAPTSCEHFSYGEVEDYTLVFGTPVPQPPVANFSGTPASLEVGGSVQFTDESTNNPTSWLWTFDGGTPGTSTAQNPTIAYNEVGNFDVNLTVTNDEGLDSKTIAEYIAVTEAGTGSYCESSSTSNALDWISQVDIGSFSNFSGESLYSDFTGQIVGLTPGSIYSITLTPHFVNKTQREFWRIWIDYNADGDFEDAGEQVFTANNKRDVVAGSITIPSDASGQTRMRITMKNGGSPSPCEVFSNGEVEDYTVDFGNAPKSLDIKREFDLIIYPNPATDALNLQLKGEFETVNVKVYNAIGKIIQEFKTTSRSTHIDLSHVSNGIYYVGADNGVHNTLKKFIKK